MTTSRDPFLDDIVRELDQDIASMDPAERERLRSLRAISLQAASPTRRFRSLLHAPRPLAWPTMAALAATLLLAGYFALRPVADETPETLMTDLAIITSDDPLELYDDIDFLSWLVTMDLDES